MSSTLLEQPGEWRWKGDRDPRWIGEWRLPNGEKIHQTLDWMLADHATLERTRRSPLYWALLSRAVSRRFKRVRRRLP